MESVANILSTKKDAVKLPAYSFQQTALDILAYLKDGDTKRSSIFKCCRDDERLARMIMAELKELDKPFSRYFLKLYNERK